MKKLACVISLFKLEKVKEALSSIGVRGIKVSEIGFGRSHRRTELYRGSEYTIEFVPKLNEIVVAEENVDKVVPKLKLEIVVAEENVDKVVETVQQAASI